MVWVLVGVRGCVAVDTGHSLVTLLSLSGRLRTDHCIRLKASHRLIILNTYLGMGAWKTCCSLIMGSDSFQTDYQGFVLVEEVLAPH